jgi:YD repeat-containing protein
LNRASPRGNLCSFALVANELTRARSNHYQLPTGLNLNMQKLSSTIFLARLISREFSRIAAAAICFFSQAPVWAQNVQYMVKDQYGAYSTDLCTEATSTEIRPTGRLLCDRIAAGLAKRTQCRYEADYPTTVWTTVANPTFNEPLFDPNTSLSYYPFPIVACFTTVDLYRNGQLSRSIYYDGGGGGQPMYRVGALPTEERSCKTTNPVQPGSGRKRFTETDYSGAGAHALSLTRHYSSRWSDGATPVGLTPIAVWEGGWRHSYQAAITARADGSLRAWRSDGTTLGLTASTTTANTWTATSGRDTVAAIVDATGTRTGWTLTAADDDSTETYDQSGKLQSIKARNGWTTTLTYSDATTPVTIAPKPGLLISVKNQFGRELKFTYDAQGRLAELLPPGAISGQPAGGTTSPIRYAYNEAASLGSNVPAQNQLSSITWQDGSVRRYHHEDGRWPNAVTGLTDEAGTRYGTYAYDSQGRVSSSQLSGGAERLDFGYATNAAGQPVTIVTDYANPGGAATSRSYIFADIGGVRYPSSLSAPCSLCGSTQQQSSYDATGNPTKTIAHDGSVTFYKYDTKGRETERATFASSYASATTRPALVNATKVISTKWHTTFNLPTQVAEPDKTTANTYNSKGLLTGTSWTATTDATGAAKFTAVKTGSTYATGWSYSASSLATTIVTKETAAGATTAVETGRWTAAYAANGDLTRITDVTGGNRIGRATTYDAQGRLVQATTIYGDAMSFVYSPRGFVTSRTEAAKTTTYVQNAIGFTTSATMPGASVATFEYDPTHRLTGVRLNGVLLAQGAAREGVPRNLALARASQLLERMVMQALPSAHAQAAGSPRLIAPGSAIAGSPLPGQPSTHPGSVLMAAGNPGDGLEPDQRPGPTPLPLFDPSLIRPLAERIAKICTCDPDGGFSKPKLTATSMIHIVMGGHASPVYRNQSYFTEPVNQTLVDEIVSRDTRPDPPGATRRVYYVADMGRVVGMSPKGDGTFEPTRAVKLIVHKDNCSNLWRVFNEVITMYPAR